MADSLNRTLLDMVRTMIIGSNGKDRERYLAEAVNCANYLRNRLYTRHRNEAMKPYGIIYNIKPNFSYIFILGCKAFIYTTKAKRTCNLDPWAEESVFVGYGKSNEFPVINLKK